MDQFVVKLPLRVVIGWTFKARKGNPYAKLFENKATFGTISLLNLRKKNMICPSMTHLNIPYSKTLLMEKR